MKINIINISMLLLLLSCNPRQTIVEITSNKGIEASLIGFSGFTEQTLFKLSSETGSVFPINTDYVGLALLRFSTGQTYPVYFGEESFSISLGGQDTPPVFGQSPENEWLYGWLASYRQLQNEKRLLEIGLVDSKGGENQIENIRERLNTIEGKLATKSKELENIKYPGVKSILQARLMNESTYDIKTREDLESRKMEYRQFVRDNIDYLYHSDMLMELCRQYLMMNEYVGFSKTGFMQQVNTDVDVLANMLSGRISKEETTRFVMGVFYGRSMLTIAGNIMDQHYALPTGDKTVEAMFKTGEGIPDLYVGDAVMGTGWHLSENKSFKILSVVGKDDIVAKTATIMLARELAEQKNLLPIIILPVDSITEAHHIMDKMFTGNLFFAENPNAQTKKAPGQPYVPQFYLLDENNIVITVTNDRAKILGIPIN